MYQNLEITVFTVKTSIVYYRVTRFYDLGGKTETLELNYRIALFCFVFLQFNISLRDWSFLDKKKKIM